MLDPVVHSALVIIAAYAIKWLFALIGLTLDEQMINTLAGIVVTYILSLFGLSLYYRGTTKSGAVAGEGRYKPPFT